MNSSVNGWSYVIAALLVLLVAWLGYLCKEEKPSPVSRGSKTYRRYNFLINEDGRYSTSKLPVYVWLGAVVGGAGMLLTEVATKAEVTLDSTNLKDLDQGYVILLGLPLGTAVINKAITTYKVSSGTLQKPYPASTPGSGQGGFFADDTGRGDLVDIQYLVFNALLLVYFVASVVNEVQFPELPTTLLGLTSVSAGIFVAKKAFTQNAPGIDAVTIDQSGHMLTIRGHNLLKPLKREEANASGSEGRPSVSPVTLRDVDQAELGQYIGVNGTTVRAVETWRDDGTRIEVSLTDAVREPSHLSVTTAAGVTATWP